MAAPSSPGSYVGEHQNGYFWNGTAWEEGPAGPSLLSPTSTSAEDLFKRRVAEDAGTATPSTAFGGTIINQQNAKPAPTTPAPAPPTDAAKRASILATIMRIESGGRNIPQAIDDINMRRGDPAQGYYQIIGDTWREFGGDKTGHKSALAAPYATQLQIAQNIPVQRWGPATQQALRAAGYEPKPGETLGQMLTRYNEDPAATKPEDLGGSTVVAAAPAAPTLPAGLLSTSAPATPIDGAKRDKEKEEAAVYETLAKKGMAMMAAEEPEAPPVRPASAGGLLQAAAPVPLPDFTKPAPTLPDFLEMLSQQRLRRA